MEPLEPVQPKSGRGGRWIAIALAVVAAIALLALAGAGGYLARSNAHRAHRWQARATQLERNADALNGLLVRRTAQLDDRVDELNTMAAKVQASRTALSRSESDVTSLVARQRELANEKAQLEDQQAALSDVADDYKACKDGLATAIGHIVDQDVAWLNANADAIDTTCGNADSAFDSYRQAFGG